MTKNLLKIYKTYVLCKCNENLTKSLLILYKEHMFLNLEHMFDGDIWIIVQVYIEYMFYMGTYVRQNDRGNTEHMFDYNIEHMFGLHIVAALKR